MDLLTAITTIGTIVGPAVVKIIQDVWQDYRTGSRAQQGLVVDPQGFQREIPNISGVFSLADLDFAGIDHEEAPILMRGRFIGEESFVDLTDIILEEEDKWVIILAVDQESEDVYFFDFDFEGYAISLWPGFYSLYAFIVDPMLDDVLGFGYPCSEDLDDPNPVIVSGEGIVELDFFIFDADDME